MVCEHKIWEIEQSLESRDLLLEELIKINKQLQQEIIGRKQAEKTLEAECQRLHSLLDGMPGFVYLMAQDYNIRFSNLHFRKRFGGQKGLCYKVLHKLDEPCKGCPTFNVFSTRSPLTWERTYPDGTTFQVHAYPIFDLDGSPLVMVLGIDITRQKQAEETLRLSEERFSKAFQANPNIMGIIDAITDQFIDVNQAFLRFFGHQLQEVIGRTVLELKLLANPGDYTQAKKTVQREGFIYNQEICLVLKSGEERVGIISVEVTELGGKKCVLVAINDITKKLLYEKEIARLDQLNIVGEMAAVIGHEIRNPMTTVRGFLQMLSGKEDCAKYKDYYGIMIEELDRANSIVAEFLSLTKDRIVDLKDHNLNAILEALFPLIESDALMHDKYIAMELGVIPSLLIDPKDMRQLILNLVRNGLEAMPPGGVLAIKTYKDGEELVLTFQDQGKGIEPNILEKLGTPFVTTKKNGTGLGLAVCYSIAARHNAKIQVETCPEGATFSVRFKIPEVSKLQ